MGGGIEFPYRGEWNDLNGDGEVTYDELGLEAVSGELDEYFSLSAEGELNQSAGKSLPNPFYDYPEKYLTLPASVKSIGSSTSPIDDSYESYVSNPVASKIISIVCSPSTGKVADMSFFLLGISSDLTSGGMDSINLDSPVSLYLPGVKDISYAEGFSGDSYFFLGLNASYVMLPNSYFENGFLYDDSRITLFGIPDSAHDTEAYLKYVYRIDFPDSLFSSYVKMSDEGQQLALFAGAFFPFLNCFYLSESKDFQVIMNLPAGTTYIPDNYSNAGYMRYDLDNFEEAIKKVEYIGAFAFADPSINFIMQKLVADESVTAEEGYGRLYETYLELYKDEVDLQSARYVGDSAFSGIPIKKITLYDETEVGGLINYSVFGGLLPLVSSKEEFLESIMTRNLTQSIVELNGLLTRADGKSSRYYNDIGVTDGILMATNGVRGTNVFDGAVKPVFNTDVIQGPISFVSSDDSNGARLFGGTEFQYVGHPTFQTDVYLNEIPENVRKIESYAFKSTNLECDYLIIPSTVEEIGSSAFSSIYFPYDLKTLPVFISKDIETIGANIFTTRRDSQKVAIYTDAESQPSGWDPEWARYCATVNYNTSLETFREMFANL